jgi:phospholipid/cholesterol/gamma-HCH transport system substrate-binding protein
MSSSTQKPLEAFLGAIVVLGFVGFSLFSYGKSTKSLGQSYVLSARFSQVEGLLQGANVRVNGVDVGQVQSITLSPTTYMVLVTFDLKKDIQIPDDSSAKIVSDGLLGGKSLAIVPGDSETFLTPGDEISHTQASISFEGLLSKFLFSAGSSDKKNAP